MVTLRLILMLAVPGRSFLWYAAIANDVWGSSCLDLLLLNMHKYLHQKEGVSQKQIALSDMLAFVCGWIHEGIILSMITGLDLGFAGFI